MLSSKKLAFGKSFFATELISFKFSSRRSSKTGIPLIRILSFGWIRCGDVYKPVLNPCVLKIDSIYEQVVPFPLLPATKTEGVSKIPSLSHLVNKICKR